MLNDDFLIDCGYKRFERSNIDPEGIECKYQKRFDDDIGKKYFITANKWRSFKHPFRDEVLPESFEFEVCFSDKETGKPIKLAFYSGWLLSEAEAMVEQLWKTGLFEYYERFDETETE